MESPAGQSGSWARTHTRATATQAASTAWTHLSYTCWATGTPASRGKGAVCPPPPPPFFFFFLVEDTLGTSPVPSRYYIGTIAFGEYVPGTPVVPRQLKLLGGFKPACQRFST